MLDASACESTCRNARSFALAAHGDQKYGDRPYAFHLDAVASLVAIYGNEAQTIAYLHDTLEDTDVTFRDIEVIFGYHVAACVALLTDEQGADRAVRKEKSYAKLRHAGDSEQMALVVKAADRLANVRACVRDQKYDLLERYRREHRQFRDAVYRPGLCEPLWSELDELISESGFLKTN